EEEAGMFLHLTMIRDSAESIAERAGRDPQEVEGLLARMAKKGLVFTSKKGDSLRYAAVPYVVGIFEHQLKTMDRELAELTEQYFQEAFGRNLSAGVTPLRTIPVNQAIEHQWPVTPYEDVRRIVESQERISVADCMCRVHQGLLGKACDKPLEVCFAFGAQAQYYVDSGLGRWIDKEEALRIIDTCDEAGLVPQPFNAQQASGMCNCCGDCCDILRSIKMHPKPADRVVANYYARVDPEACTACETCLTRCQMDAIAVESDDAARVNRDRCIGCGLCVTTCPSGARNLEAKPPVERREPPARGLDTIMAMARAREDAMSSGAGKKRPQG
ncbi:MAG: 4Fe-4S binding protein, partial [Deltaproteobacteria bacterium]